MDFEKALQKDLESVFEKVEAGLEKETVRTKVSPGELEEIVRAVVKEELKVAVKDITATMEKMLRKALNSQSSALKAQPAAAKKESSPKPEKGKTVTYDLLEEARYTVSMTCGGWTYFANKREGDHLWAVNSDGSQGRELYPRTISRVTKIEDGYVYFRDAEYRELRVSAMK